MSRRSVKAALKTYLSTVTGVKTVFEGMPKLIVGAQMPAVVILIPDSDTSQAVANAGFGKRKVEYNVRLVVVEIDERGDAVAGALAFEDIIDAIESKLRTTPQLDAVTGWPIVAATKPIRTETAEAREAGKDSGNVHRLATIEFPITDFITG